jgi:hypothetical protein
MEWLNLRVRKSQKTNPSIESRKTHHRSAKRQVWVYQSLIGN